MLLVPLLSWDCLLLANHSNSNFPVYHRKMGFFYKFNIYICKAHLILVQEKNENVIPTDKILLPYLLIHIQMHVCLRCRYTFIFFNVKYQASYFFMVTILSIFTENFVLILRSINLKILVYPSAFLR